MNPSPREILDEVARTNMASEKDLFPDIAARLGGKTSLKLPHGRPVLVVAVVLLTLLLASGVVYALGRDLGYIPGVGLIDRSNEVLVLPSPVSVSRGGITLSVETFVSDAARTYVHYQVDNIPPASTGAPICTDPPELQLEDGNVLEITGGGSGGVAWNGGAPARFVTGVIFPPLPTGSEKVFFISPCKMPTLALALSPASADLATPVVEIDSTYEAAGPDALNAADGKNLTEGGIPELSTAVANASGLRLNHVLETENSYILVGNFTDAGDLPGIFIGDGTGDFYFPRIEDAHGEPVPITVRTDIRPDEESSGVYPWAYEIQKPVEPPIKLTIDTIEILQSDTGQFQVDTGVEPQVGEKWDLALAVELGEYDFVVDQVERVEKGFLVNFHSEMVIPGESSVRLSIPGLSPSVMESASDREYHRATHIDYRQFFLSDESLPTGRISFELTLDRRVQLRGPWTLFWAPQNP